MTALLSLLEAAVATHPREQYRNELLRRLSGADLALIEPGLAALPLPLRKSLQRRGSVIADVYFVETGIVSVVALGAKREKPVEAGLIGREGMTGIELILADNRSQQDVYIQVAGSGHHIKAADLQRATEESESLRRLFLRFAGGFLTQVTETALANGSATIDRRLSRWLLMAQDRLDDAALPLTHEFLGLMLGVRRSGVTVAIQELAHDGLVESRRGRVVIVDRAGLIERAGDIYGRSHAEQQRLLD